MAQHFMRVCFEEISAYVDAVIFQDLKNLKNLQEAPLIFLIGKLSKCLGIQSFPPSTNGRHPAT